MKATITHETPVRHTARVLQMAGMFDLPLEEKTRLRIDADLPIETRTWNIGLIVGPSGSGKSSIARHLWPTELVTEQHWAPDGALLDDFPTSLGINDVVNLLTAVGLGSPQRGSDHTGPSPTGKRSARRWHEHSPKPTAPS